MDWGLLDHSERRVFKIPVGDKSKEEVEELLRELLKSYDYNKFLLRERKNKLDKIMGKINEK
jgi:hypothetical protein